ncbi:2',3'-cyclic-nucleotide 2'-phosphodiesterase (5'-nucleotidase family) [Streptomyces umbrinus]|uniref:2',3'-cyclic-nucleotide 2'-phosphodiesterase (5'-nucleotidase family) n=1 Tax=Streptomyces umbrinus TaxID=67370 RepID=A0ABU0T6N4_9ACTN|nr:metallophosphoesterase [Streptomyces umbrinus]MDQ1031454.1 2',3'-cyclic-nucleotide 2'-phosphodiesterase (5'-nucleotidase family) [Streptomyces umbrinus]
MITLPDADRRPSSILATTDFHSSLDQPVTLTAHLSRARPTTLVVDSGDFFEGTHYPVSRGRIEQRILTEFYDVITPGNHGWSHYTSPGLRPLVVCANIVHQSTGAPYFQPFRLAAVGEQTVTVTAIIGQGISAMCWRSCFSQTPA